MTIRILLVAMSSLLMACQLNSPEKIEATPAADDPIVETVLSDELEKIVEEPEPVPEPLGALNSDTEPELDPDPDSPEQETQPEAPDKNAVARAQCVKKRGSFTRTSTGAFICVQRTGDGNKSCKSGTHCEGSCLARSGTCAPVSPLVGCHEIITNRGSRATVCID